MDELADPLVERAIRRVGAVLREKWRLDALLGVGGMAAVYAATHRNGRRGAVKVLHPELAVHQDVRNRFLREGYAANRVEHPGAVAVLDDDVADDGSVFLVMELLDGESLQARCERLGGRLDPAEVLSIADQLLDVLGAAHANGVIHRDLKPENMFVTRDSQLKVLDFGIARVRELSASGSATRTGVTMGTPAFMPPEAAHGRWDLVDARTDLWAVGATLYTLLTGRLVHQAATVSEQLVAAMTRPARPVSAELPYLHPAVAEVVDRALAFDKHDRWSDAQTMQEAVRAAYHQAFRSPITTAPSLTVPPTEAEQPCDATSIWRDSTRTSGPMVAGRTGVARAVVGDRWATWIAAGAGATMIASLVVLLIVFAVRPSMSPDANPTSVASPSASSTRVGPLSSAPPSVDAGKTSVDNVGDAGRELVTATGASASVGSTPPARVPPPRPAASRRAPAAPTTDLLDIRK